MSALWHGVLLTAIMALEGGIVTPATYATTSTASSGETYSEQVLAEAALPPGAVATSVVDTHLLGIESEPFGFPSSNQYDAHARFPIWVQRTAFARTSSNQRSR
jgi:hypothetical protein